MRGGGRPGPYERSGPPMGRGFGPNGPGGRAPRGMKSNFSKITIFAPEIQLFR